VRIAVTIYDLTTVMQAVRANSNGVYPDVSLVTALINQNDFPNGLTPDASGSSVFDTMYGPDFTVAIEGSGGSSFTETVILPPSACASIGGRNISQTSMTINGAPVAVGADYNTVSNACGTSNATIVYTAS
jgi:hypothetical protein